MTVFVGYCLRGLENLLAEELVFQGFAPMTTHQGMVIFKGQNLLDIPYLNHHIRLAENIDLLLHRQVVVGGLNDIEAILTDIDYRQVFDPKLSFAVRAIRYGKHDFNSDDLMRVTAKAMTQSMNRYQCKVHANLKEPDLYFRVCLDQDQLVLGLCTNGAPLSSRYPLPYAHEAPLNRTLAAALVWNSSFRHHGQILDPMCGGGTILIESAFWRNDDSFEKLDRPYAYSKHSYIQNLHDQNLKRRPSPIYHIPKDKDLCGVDRSETILNGTKRNLEGLGCAETIQLRKGNARKLVYLSEDGLPLVVTNPPYGIRIMRPRDADELYRDFAQAVYQRRVQEIVAITPKKRSWLDSFDQAGYHLHSVIPVHYGDMPAFIMKHQLPGISEL